MTAISLSHPQIHPGGVPLLNNYLEFKANPLGFWFNVGKQGPVVKVNLGPKRPFWVITDADLFQTILAKKAKNFPRDRQIRDRKGLDRTKTVFNAPTYEEWLWRRRLLQPAFHTKQLKGFAETFVSETQRLIEEVDLTTPIDLVFMMKTLTMRIICKTMFSASVAETAVLQNCFERLGEFNYRRLSAALKLPLWVPTPHKLDAQEASNTRWEMVEEIVQERLTSGEAKGDLLDMLISAQLDDEEAFGNGGKFDGEDLVSEMLSIIFAGHDTTAMTMVWLIYLMTQYPEVEQKLRAEVDGVLNGRTITLEDIDNMPYTHQLIQETLRMYPTVYLTLREAEEDDLLGDYPIPGGTQLVINIRGIHRDPTHWNDPESFRPERFTPENNKARHKFAYLPFLAGPKKCIGDSFAMMEMRLVIPTLVQALNFTYASNKPAKEKAGFVMETAEPVMMKVEKQVS